MKYLIFIPLLLLTACGIGMSPEEVKAREQYCYKNGAKGVNMLILKHNKSVSEVRCVFDGYETDSRRA